MGSHYSSESRRAVNFYARRTIQSWHLQALLPRSRWDTVALHQASATCHTTVPAVPFGDIHYGALLRQPRHSCGVPDRFGNLPRT